MREVFDLHKFCDILYQKCREYNLDVDPGGFDQSEIYQVLSETIAAVPLENRYYNENDIDWFYKINLALINKFRDQLREEYGTTMIDTFNMFQTLYKKQNELTPLKWYEYGMCEKQ